MKRVLPFLLLFTACSPRFDVIEVVPDTVKDPWDDFITALIQVESEGNTNAIGDGGKAVGVLQIHPIMVDEANRHGGCFTYEDRYDSLRSVRIFNIIQAQYNPSRDIRKALQIWNPRASQSYYDKVCQHISNLH